MTIMVFLFLNASSLSHIFSKSHHDYYGVCVPKCFIISAKGYIIGIQPQHCSLQYALSISSTCYESTERTRHVQGTPGKVFPPLVWPLQLGLRTPTLRCGHLSGPSRTRWGFFDFEVGGHAGAYKDRVHVIVPFVGRKNGDLIDRQQSYNVLVLRVPGLNEGVNFGGKAL